MLHRALVTGATGFIGSQLTPFIQHYLHSIKIWLPFAIFLFFW